MSNIIMHWTDAEIIERNDFSPGHYNGRFKLIGGPYAGKILSRGIIGFPPDAFVGDIYSIFLWAIGILS